jgi:fructoselysine 6-kinase
VAIKTIAVSVGDNCIDHYLPPIERSFVGGNALNVSVYMQRAGILTAYIGVVGDDEQGKLIRDTLIKEGVDISWLQVNHGTTSYTDIRLTPEGDRQFIHEHVGPTKSLELDKATVDTICQHKLTHNTWLGGTDKYLAQFKRADTAVSMDYGERYSQDFFQSTIRNVDLAFFSLPEEKACEAKDLARLAVNQGALISIVTLGREGSLAYDGKLYTQPSKQVRVIDTLGAGDTFIGVFLAQWLKKRPIPQCLLAASKAAAYTCTHYGAWDDRIIDIDIGTG